MRLALRAKRMMKMVSAGSAEVIQIELNGYQVLSEYLLSLDQAGPRTTNKGRSTQNVQSTRHSQLNFGRK